MLGLVNYSFDHTTVGKKEPVFKPVGTYLKEPTRYYFRCA